MSKSPMSLEEISESLTGYDEIAIEKATGEIWTELAEHNPTRYVRALVAVDLQRQSKGKYADAYKSAMELTAKDVLSYFATDDGLDQEPGKGDELSESETKS